jgi:hypothetical protein
LMLGCTDVGMALPVLLITRIRQLSCDATWELPSRLELQQLQHQWHASLQVRYSLQGNHEHQNHDLLTTGSSLSHVTCDSVDVNVPAGMC